jgi:hypothetical protein
MRVSQNLVLKDGFGASGDAEEATVRLLAVRVGGQLNCSGATISNASGPALAAEGLRVDEGAVLADGFEAVGAGGGGVVLLDEVHVRGPLQLVTRGISNSTHPQALLSLDGLTYGGIPEKLSVSQWLAILRWVTPRYAAQPYQQLAVVHRAAGHDNHVRRILIEQRRQQIRSRALTGVGERAWARFTGLTLGYGYHRGAR